MIKFVLGVNDVLLELYTFVAYDIADQSDRIQFVTISKLITAKRVMCAIRLNNMIRIMIHLK